MKGLLRLLAWVTLLTWPYWLVRESYHGMLAMAATVFYTNVGLVCSFETIDMLAPLGLIFYVSLCLSTPEPWRRRATACVVGGLLLVAIDLTVAIAGVGLVMAETEHGPIPIIGTVFKQLSLGLPWVAALGLWSAFRGLPGFDTSSNRPGRGTSSCPKRSCVGSLPVQRSLGNSVKRSQPTASY